MLSTKYFFHVTDLALQFAGDFFSRPAILHFLVSSRLADGGPGITFCGLTRAFDSICRA